MKYFTYIVIGLWLAIAAMRLLSGGLIGDGNPFGDGEPRFLLVYEKENLTLNQRSIEVSGKLNDFLAENNIDRKLLDDETTFVTMDEVTVQAFNEVMSNRNDQPLPRVLFGIGNRGFNMPLPEENVVNTVIDKIKETL